MKNGHPKIESGIPMPHRAYRGQFVFMKDMKVGDSVFFDKADSTKIRNACQEHLGVGGYVTRVMDGGIRVWKTEKRSQER